MTHYTPIPEVVENTASACVDCGIHVHRVLGPGFKELIYTRAYCLELDSRGIKYECEKAIMVRYKNWEIPGQKVDLIVAGLVLIEIKAVPKVREIHRLQTLSYLRTTGLRLGLVMNFNTPLLKDGLKRVVLQGGLRFRADGFGTKNTKPRRARRKPRGCLPPSRVEARAMLPDAGPTGRRGGGSEPTNTRSSGSSSSLYSRVRFRPYRALRGPAASFELRRALFVTPLVS